MEAPTNNVIDLNGLPDSERVLLTNLLNDYEHCNDRRRNAIRRFAHKLAELELPLSPSATIFPFPK